jgi:hypothetical protein
MGAPERPAFDTRCLVALAACLLAFTVSSRQKQPSSRQLDSLYRQGLAAAQIGDLPKARAVPNGW